MAGTSIEGMVKHFLIFAVRETQRAIYGSDFWGMFIAAYSTNKDGDFGAGLAILVYTLVICYMAMENPPIF
jgi:hypothetical protein